MMKTAEPVRIGCARAPRGILGAARDSCEEKESGVSSPIPRLRRGAAAAAPLYAIDAALPHAIVRPSSSKFTPLLLQSQIVRQVPTPEEVRQLRHAQNARREETLRRRREAEECQYSEQSNDLLRRVVALVARLFF